MRKIKFFFLLFLVSTVLSAMAEELQGDIDSSGRVDANDLFILMSEWHRDTGNVTPTFTPTPSATITLTPSPTPTNSPTPTPTGTLAPGSQARVVIKPEEMSFDFSGQNMRIEFTCGDEALEAGHTVYFRANFWLYDPTASEEERGQGFQTLNSQDENFAILYNADNQTSATLSLSAGLVNQQKRILVVEIERGRIEAGESFFVTLRNLHSMVEPPSEGVTCAGGHAFWCAVGDPDGENPEPDHALTYSIIEVEGGELKPGAPTKVFAVVPSLVDTGASVPVRLSVLDASDNPVQDFEGSVRLECTAEAAVYSSTVTFSSENRGTISIPAVIEATGIHQFTVSADGLENSHSNIFEVTNAAVSRGVFWGDYHSHSLRCDGTGGAKENCSYARDYAHLDWYCLSSHDAPRWHYAGAMRWDTISRIVDNVQTPGQFVTLPAYEWTSPFHEDGDSGDGHRIVLCTDWNDLLPVMRNSDEEYDSSSELYRGMMRRTQDFLIVPHHADSYQWWHLPAQGAAAELSFEEKTLYMPLVEIYSQTHGNCERPDEEPMWRESKDWNTSPERTCYAVGGLAQGTVAGFMAGGDSHSGRPGSHMFGAFTAVIADDLSRSGLLEAFRKRHTYASSGGRPIVRFSSGQAMMGDVIYSDEQTQAPSFKYEIISAEAIQRVSIVRAISGSWQTVFETVLNSESNHANGAYIDEAFDTEWPFASYYLVAEYNNPGTHFIYRDSTDRCWTSPIFFKKFEE